MFRSGYFLACVVMFTVLFEMISVTQGTESVTEYATECKLSAGGHRYAGTQSTTISGNTCQAWNSKSPHYQTYMNHPESFPGGNVDASINYCRNPDSTWHGGVWCYTTNHTVRWEHCDVGLCECKVSDTGIEYGGQINVTSSGRPCQSWSSQTPHNHTYIHGDQFLPDYILEDASNYCRNPGGENASRPDGPWCFTNVPSVAWEYCNVERCGFQLVTIDIPTTTSTTTTTTTTTPTTTTTVPPTATARPPTSTTRPPTTTTTTRSPTTTTRPPTTTTRRTTTNRTPITTTPITTTTITTHKTTTRGTTASTRSVSSKTSTPSIPHIVRPEGPDQGKPAASTSQGTNTTTIVSSVVCVVVVILCVVTGVVLYKRGVFNKFMKQSQGGKEKLEESFDNPSFNVEKDDVVISPT